MNKKSIRRIIHDANLVISENQGLSLVYHESYPRMLAGTYVVKDTFGMPQDNFDIQVVIPDSYPFEFPTLKEIGGKIPRVSDRHISTSGVACVENVRIIDILKVHGIDLLTFFQKYVHRYFCWQIVFEVDKSNRNLAAWRHEEDGIRDFYYEFLGTLDTKFIKEGLTAIYSNKLPPRNDPCLCKKGKKYKHCHSEKFEIIKNRFSKECIAADIKLW